MKTKAVLLLICFLVSCNKEDDQITTGQVVMENGSPVNGAEIHYIPNLSNILDSKPKRPSRAITVIIPQSGNVKLETIVAWNDELVETLVDRYMTPGSYNFSIAESLYTNRVYNIELTIPGVDTTITSKILFSATAEELIGVKPLAITSSSGHFELENGEFGIGERFRITEPTGPGSYNDVIITNIMEFIAIKNGEIIASLEVELDEEKENNIRLVVK